MAKKPGSKLARKKTFIVPDEAIRGLRWVHGLLPFLPDDQVKAIKDDWFESIFGIDGQYLKVAWTAENLAAAASVRTKKKNERVEIVSQECEAFWTKRSENGNQSRNGRQNAAFTTRYLRDRINKKLQQAGHQGYTAQSLEKLIRKISHESLV
jgi:hypothetical protein